MLLAHLHPQQRQFLIHLAEKIAELDWHLYLVGGGVRDLFLAQKQNKIITLSDIDIVLDQAPANAIEQLIPHIQTLRPGAVVQPHPKFHTCDLRWPDLALDIALARRETYPHPTANPIVTPADIHQDLYRRDFSINAMALGLHPAGILLDPLDGQNDLQQRYLRVLHPHSFQDDPTRLWRGVRYGVRYGLTFAPETLAQWQDTLASGIYEHWRQQPGQAPALQTRLRAELHYLWQTPGWVRAGRWLEQLGAWACIHPNLHWTGELERTLRYGSFGTIHQSHRPHCLTELLLSYVPAEERESVARHLDLALMAQKRLGQLAHLESQLQLLPRLPVSQICQKLEGYQPDFLYGVMVRQRGELQSILCNYLQHWSQQKPPLNGQDLRLLGYPPGSQFRQILSQVRSAFLDREITNRAEAITYVEQHFPRALPGQ
ncbi:polyA polymerase [Gloeomargarita lithophora Alchichica-D10]|uniref:PolyA polymerase n=1 Tax=Gloeomargarita lithophora Alchichica-D10 TaxID=1188229 RepID=A0A1J0AFY8_9CYAN|nr:CCA tRNA nucleotidyltransferase [Gloeomargarita lithophora]APB34824.1 polyA polymerase [Gloeomargarita lithophora Alchichica-D10]